MTGQATPVAADVPPARPQADEAVDVAVDAAELVLEDRFSIVPEWVLDADIGDCALRLYAVLLRYGNSTGARMPARATLATRLHKRSTDTVDRALAELVDLGAVQVESRWAGRQRLTNRYRIRTSRPHRRPTATEPASALAPMGGGRTDAATRTGAAGGGRANRVRVAARMRQDRESSTDTPPPPTPPRAHSRDAKKAPPGDTVGHWQARQRRLLAGCDISGDSAWDDYVLRVHEARRNAGQPLTRWSAAHLATALDLAVRGRGWPPDQAAEALLQVAADPATRSPARLAEAGPWWDQPDTPSATQPVPPVDLAAAEAELDAVDGQRLQLQQQARQQLAAERQPVTRTTVIQRAVELLHASK